MNHPWNVIAYGLRVQISRTQVSIEWTMERDYARAESSNWCQISIDWISKLWTAWRTSWEFKVDIIRSELPLQARNSTHSWSQVNILYQFPFVIGNRRIFRHMNTGQFDLDLPLAGSTETSCIMSRTITVERISHQFTDDFLSSPFRLFQQSQNGHWYFLSSEKWTCCVIIMLMTIVMPGWMVLSHRSWSVNWRCLLLS